MDTNSLSTDPLFVDVNGAFYALRITLSPANGGTAATWPPGVSNLYFPAGANVTATATNHLGFI